ncbi:MAG: molybdenum cofactor guanylyltransferase [Chloroflexi bacterium]|nr:molybdenum cofactor guanylyltransferase [Chloroflexota bacterium]
MATAVSGIILAGGKSLRYGKDKALETVGGKTLIDWTISAMNAVPEVRELLVVTNQSLAGRLTAAEVHFSDEIRGAGMQPRLVPRLVYDSIPGLGPLVGIYDGLSAAAYPFSLVVGCDMPFLNPDLLGHLVGLAPGFDIVMPRTGHLIEPLHAVYSKTCIAPIQRLFAGGKPMVYLLPEGLNVRYVEQDEITRFDPHCLSFFNINSLSDMEKARSIAEDSGRSGPFQKAAGNE